MRTMAVFVPGRELNCLEDLIGNSYVVEPCTDDFAAAIVDAPIRAELALPFPPLWYGTVPFIVEAFRPGLDP